MTQFNDSIFSIHARFCSIMGNEKRIKIMWLLGNVEEMTVGEIASELDTSLANASQHLRIMRDQKAVFTRKDKQQVYYRLSNRNFFEGCKKIHQGLAELQLVQSELFNTTQNDNMQTQSDFVEESKSA